jgi:geranylgeranylglycerol-phosphate geranylgeranyltransferase
MANHSSPANSTFTTLIRSFRAFIHLFRLPVGILAALAGCATVAVLNAATPLTNYLLTAFILSSMTSAACAINDYWDIDKDCIDHPDRPLPSGQLTLSQAWWAAIVLFSGAIVAAVPLGLAVFCLVAVSTVLLWHYSHLLLYSGILGNVVVAASITTLILLGSLVAQRPFAMLYPAGFLFCYALVKKIIWDVHDTIGDRSQGIITIANQGRPGCLCGRLELVGYCAAVVADRDVLSALGTSNLVWWVFAAAASQLGNSHHAVSATTERRSISELDSVGTVKHGVWGYAPC